MSCQACKKNGELCTNIAKYNGFCGIHKKQGLVAAPAPVQPPVPPVSLDTCPICQDEIKVADREVTSCGHAYHRDCYVGMICRKAECCVCRTPVLTIDSKHKKDIDKTTDALHKDAYKEFKKLDAVYIVKQRQCRAMEMQILDIQRHLQQLQLDMTTKLVVDAQEQAKNMIRLHKLRQDVGAKPAGNDPTTVPLWGRI